MDHDITPMEGLREHVSRSVGSVASHWLLYVGGQGGGGRESDAPG